MNARNPFFNSRNHASPTRLASAVLSLAVIPLSLVLAGCNKTPVVPDDAALASQVNNRLQADQNLAGQPIQASVANGVVTLNGTVISDAARGLASDDVAQVPGVRTVVDNLVVQAPPAEAAVAPPPASSAQERKEQQRMAREEQQRMAEQQRRERHAKPSPAVAEQIAPPPPPAPPQSAPVVRIAPPPQPVFQTPPPPPVPVIHNLTIAAGTTIPVRITQTLDSATSQTGDTFTGAVAADIIIDGMVAIPQGTPVTGHVDDVHDATHFKGNSLLSLSLTSINRHGERLDVATDEFTKEGSGRGKNTAEKVGGGAVVGAILGGIFGGGKGAAIGSVAGGGLGAGAQAATRGQQVQVPSESVVRFSLTNPVLVHVTTGPDNDNRSRPTLERHNNQQ